MPTSPLNGVIQHLRADLRPDGDGLTDGELLARFVRSRDEDALAALVWRHAPMVWGVCCRLLRNRHDTEDAFQATFLVLVRKAGCVPEKAVANWLYGVARQTAVRVRALAAKRGRRETQVVNMPEPIVPEVRDADLQAAVEEELSRLPDHYRGVVVLCDLEGMTRKEAARQLGIPEGSVASRLARARAMLAKRLARRGVVFSGSSVAAVLSAGSAPSSAPPALVASTIKAASLLAAGPAAGIVTAEVAALTDGVVKAMFMTKLKSVLAAAAVGVLALTTLAVGVAGGKPPAQERAKKPDDPAERLVGTWTVKFENGVNEWCRVNKDRTAKVVEPQRRSPGKVETRDGAVLIVCDDDRLERWTPVGDGAVVEHWCPTSAYPKEKPVKGIAERTTADEPPQLPPHFVEKPDMKPLFDSDNKVDGEPNEELIRVYSKAFISDSRYRGRIRFRDIIDPRYLKKHGLTDKDITYEIGDNTGLRNYHVADDIRTILIEVDAKGGGRELIVVRWVLHEGHLYLSPAPPDPKTGIFKLWILRTKLIETKPSPPPVPNDKQREKPSHVVEKPDMKARMDSGLPEKVGRVGGEPTEEDVRVMSTRFFSKMRTYPDIRFREFFDPRYLKKHGLTDRDIAFEVVGDVGIHDIVVADDNRTVLCTVDTPKDGKSVRETFLLRWVLHDGCLSVSPEKAPDPKGGIFTPWILRTKVN